jgi:hypothetical protein
MPSTSNRDDSSVSLPPTHSGFALLPMPLMRN